MTLVQLTSFDPCHEGTGGQVLVHVHGQLQFRDEGTMTSSPQGIREDDPLLQLALCCWNPLIIDQ